jgi:hypothetical protein
MAVALLPEDVSPTALPPPPLRTTPEDERSTRPKAAVSADLVSSHAGLSQSSPPIVFSNDASGSSLLLLLALPPLTSLPLELEDVIIVPDRAGGKQSVGGSNGRLSREKQKRIEAITSVPASFP